MFVGAEQDLAAFDGGVPVVHAEGLEPAVGHRPVPAETEITVASMEGPGGTGGPSIAYAVSISTYEPAWISVAQVLRS